MGHNLQQLLPDHIAQAICRTLISSVWQGLVLAMLTGMIILFTKKVSAAKRYGLLVGLLCLFTLSFIFTLIVELNSADGSDYVIQDVASHSMNLLELLNYNLLYIEKHAAIVVLTWLVIISARSFKMVFGLYIIQRLKRTKINHLSVQWEQKVSSLAQNMGVKKAIILLESGIVKVPVVIGYLKPLILIPVGLINALDQGEVEAILLHELAHIRRRDYLVNLLQSLIETLFFFNPAILWLSSLIRTEREHCCDDIALRYTQNKTRYIRALVHFEEYQADNTGYALALTGKGGNMLQRLERIAINRNRSLNRLEMAGLALLLLVSSLFVAARPNNKVEITQKTTKTTPVSPELRRYYHERELALRKQFLERKRAEEKAKHRMQPTDSVP